ncbi:class I SAM-dependent methyltransferase [Opitutus sp. ER46]|uniref:class I SAM-dependent methyltransferase n=1 Tax=Opitutus sp. ER46 TaxID=2161864 RepID=UPI000D31571B|nr:class I SAM-dependent methyltransferase [Opitutus sp. ER46]PTX91572.1 SAM-dependent methyltransferase [Opitutus sp. ER46]
MNAPDRANGYETSAAAFMGARSNRGEAVVRTWARRLPSGASVLDVGCGHGVPVSQVLVDERLVVYGLDASPTLLADFRRRFPHAVTACSTIEESDFFARTFAGVVAWGVVFLLPPDVQALLIHKAARALAPGGLLLFTAPHQACEWTDALTGGSSVSLGAAGYTRLLAAEGMSVIAQGRDDGDNHYYIAAKDNSGGSGR